MDAYVPKPISSQRLRKTIHRLVPVENTRNAVQSAPEELSPPTLDPNHLLSAFDNDQAFLQEIISMFLSDYPNMLEEIETTIKAQDAPALERSAHALKGMLGNFRADHAAAMALRLEEMGRTQQLDNAEQLCGELSSALNQLELAFRRLAKEEID